MTEVYSRNDEVLELVADHDGIASPQMVYTHDDTDISQSRTYSAMHTLDDRGQLERIEDGLYRITTTGEDRLEEIRHRGDELTPTFDTADPGWTLHDDIDADPDEFEFAGEGGDTE